MKRPPAAGVYPHFVDSFISKPLEKRNSAENPYVFSRFARIRREAAAYPQEGVT